MKKGIICLVYVDSTLFFGETNEINDDYISHLHKIGFASTVEEDIESFLGVQVKKLDNGAIKMSQPALTQTIIEIFGLKD